MKPFNACAKYYERPIKPWGKSPPRPRDAGKVEKHSGSWHTQALRQGDAALCSCGGLLFVALAWGFGVRAMSFDSYSSSYYHQ